MSTLNDCRCQNLVTVALNKHSKMLRKLVLQCNRRVIAELSE